MNQILTFNHNLCMNGIDLPNIRIITDIEWYEIDQ